MYAPFYDALSTADLELLTTGHWNPVEDFLSRLSELLSLQNYKHKDFISLIPRVCPGVVEFRTLRDPVTREPKYYVRSMGTVRRKFRGYPRRCEIEIPANAGDSHRRAQPKFETLPAHVGAMGNWKPLEISNMSAALRAGKGSIAGPSDFVLDERRNEHKELETPGEW